MNEIVIVERTGDAPLEFEGQLVAEASSHEDDGALKKRWHEIKVWSTTTGRPVVAVVYRTTWEKEHDHHFAVVSDDSVQTLRDYDPTEHVLGYPPGTQYVEKQARLLAELRAGYDRALSEAAKHWPEKL